MEKINCRVTSCSWSGETRDLLEHCETDHKRFIKYINQDVAFTFQLRDVQEDAFLLCGGHIGLFWLLRDPKKCEAYIRSGVFAVNDGDSMEYVARIGKMGDEMVTYLGPYMTSSDEERRYDMEWSLHGFQDIESSKVMEVCFGDVDEMAVCREEECEAAESPEIEPLSPFDILDPTGSTEDIPANFEEAKPLFEDYIRWKFAQSAARFGFSAPRISFSEDDLSSDENDDTEDDVEEDCERSSVPPELDGFDDLRISDYKDEKIAPIFEGISDGELEDGRHSELNPSGYHSSGDNGGDSVSDTDNEGYNLNNNGSLENGESFDTGVEDDIEKTDGSEEESGEYLKFEKVVETDHVVVYEFSFEHGVGAESFEAELFLAEDHGFEGFFDSMKSSVNDSALTGGCGENHSHVM